MRLRFDSPIVLAVVGTASIHLLLFTATDVASTLTRGVPEPAPELEMFDVDTVPAPPTPPPPPPQAAKTPEPVHSDPVPVAKAPVRVASASHPHSEAPRPASDLPPAPGATGGNGDRTDGDYDPNGDLPSGSRDAHGARGTGGGRGGGSGSGAGGSASGAGAPPPDAPSIATIKKRALPKGDYGLVEAGRDYPQEAKQLGIQGPIRVRLVVDVAGHVGAATLLNHLGHGLDEIALREARRIEFEPAIDTDDKPTASIVVWTFHFTLPKE
nr:energy transducer TonB [Kofleriaceae bacterium]